MHEHGPVALVVDQLDRLHRHRPLTAAEIVIGPTIDPSVAVAAFEHIVAGTDLSSIDITWTQGLDTLTCLSCGTDYSGTKLDTCPGCGGVGLVVEPANEVTLGRVEVGG